MARFVPTSRTRVQFESMKKRILIVDDDLSVRQSLQEVLDHCGYSVVVAVDGEAAETKMTEGAIDLLVVDLNMPRKDGWDVLDDARAKCPLAPIIVITGMADQLATLRIAGAAALMKKPVDPGLLLHTIEKLLAETPEQRLRRISPCLEQEAPHRLEFAL
jgi:CheY-like chemotaxis protein